MLQCLDRIQRMCAARGPQPCCQRAGGMLRPHPSCCTNRVRHPLFSMLFLQILIEWLRWHSKESLTPSSNDQLWVSMRKTLFACSLPALGVALAQYRLGKLSLCVCFSPLSVHRRVSKHSLWGTMVPSAGRVGQDLSVALVVPGMDAQERSRDNCTSKSICRLVVTFHC